MAVLEILTFPDPRLRRTTTPVTEFNAELSSFIDDMFDTMYDAPGVGLAATQVGDTRRVAVMDCGGDAPDPIVMCNPEILWQREPVDVDEGCLSVPGHTDQVVRYKTVGFRAQDRNGAWYECEAHDLLAQCVQHELAHLYGGLYIDQLSHLKRKRIRKRVEKTDRTDGGA